MIKAEWNSARLARSKGRDQTPQSENVGANLPQKRNSGELLPNFEKVWF
jgi:hypothetical protein